MSAVLVLGEIAVTVLALDRERDQINDPDIGWSVPAGAVVRWGWEGSGVTHYVGDGEIATPHREGPVVIVLGDSHTEAYQVNDSQKFTSVAENILWLKNKRLDLRNHGRSGCSFADYVYLVGAFRERFRPAAFVVQLDEFDFDSHAFDSTQANYFREKPDGRIELVHKQTPPETTRKPSFRKRLSRASHLVNYACSRMAILWSQRILRANAQSGRLNLAQSVAQQAELLRQAAGGTPVVLLRLTYSPYDPNRKGTGNETFQVLRRALPEWPYIDASPEFLESRERGRDPRTFFNGSPFGGHLNTRGHEIAGTLLAAELERLLAP